MIEEKRERVSFDGMSAEDIARFIVSSTGYSLEELVQAIVATQGSELRLAIGGMQIDGLPDDEWNAMGVQVRLPQ